MQKGNIKNTASEILPFLVQIISPEIISNPSFVITKTLSSIATYFLTKLSSEYKEKLEDKKIKGPSFTTQKQILSFLELLKIINDGEIDEDRFRAIKSIFFSSISKDATEEDEFLAYEFLQTAKKLVGTEILILKANLEIANGNINPEITKDQLSNAKRHRGAWRHIIAIQMGYKGMGAIVIKYEKNLESLGLISPRNDVDRFQGEFDTTSPASNFRLTETGKKFCEFMTNYK